MALSEDGALPAVELVLEGQIEITCAYFEEGTTNLVEDPDLESEFCSSVVTELDD